MKQQLFHVNLTSRKVSSQTQRGQVVAQTVNKGAQKTLNQGSEKAEKCTFYGKEGHNKDGCFKKIGYLDWWPGKKDKPKPKVACVKVGPNPIHGLMDE